MENNIYAIKHYGFVDKIVIKKRLEIIEIIKNNIANLKIEDVLDIGTTKDFDNESSNLIVKGIKGFNKYKSISDQKIDSEYFDKCLTKSITDSFSISEIKDMTSDLVISSAAIEHVGNKSNQIKMIENIIKLTNKIFIITTPNRYYPIDFHTKLPLIHWFSKKFHRFCLKKIGLDFFSKEENLNLISKNDIIEMLEIFKKNIEFKIHTAKLLGLVSNLIIIGKIKI